MAVVLVAEDDPDISELLGMLIEELGHEAVLTSTGEEALRRCRQEPPDAAVLDVAMPGDIDGLDVTRALRADPRTRQVPVLLLTARAQDVDVVAGYEAGADHYLVKPFRVEELLSALESLTAPR